MDPPVEYFHGEMLRWSFGFENPNKAAVIFACLIPIFWSGWLASWRLTTKLQMAAALTACGIGSLGMWLCLLVTFSRGGIIGALAGTVLVTGWAKYERGCGSACVGKEVLKRPAAWWSVAILLIVLAASLLLGVGRRSLEAIGGDASVGNRFELWKKALQMAYDNPAGFGVGNSGGEFMQWYQVLDRTEGYRTMVNSYLTFLVEHGWFIMAAVLLAGTVFWAWTWPRRGERLGDLKAALWGSLAAFLVSGIFSTTMEEPTLFIVPALAVFALTACSIRPVPPRGIWQRTVPSLAVASGLCALLFAVGWYESGEDPLRREFGGGVTGERSVVAIEPKATSDAAEVLGVIPDATVLGPNWGKLLRDAALRGGRKVLILRNQQSSMNVDRLVVCGEAVSQLRGEIDQPLVLVAPAMLNAIEFQPRAGMTVLLPEIDEDGRARAWREILEGVSFPKTKVEELAGVGTQIDWAWEQVLQVLTEA
jgi:hypothetical protein